MKRLAAASALLGAALLICGADATDRVLDLAAPRVFPIEGDVPILPPPAQPAATPASPVPVGPAATAAATPTPFTLAPAPAPIPVPTPVSAWPLAPATFTVQVGAFRAPEQARALADRLIRHGYDAFVVTVELSTAGDVGVWHRVRVGRFPDRQPAADLAARLVAAERVPAQVLRDAP